VDEDYTYEESINNTSECYVYAGKLLLPATYDLEEKESNVFFQKSILQNYGYLNSLYVNVDKHDNFYLLIETYMRSLEPAYTITLQCPRVILPAKTTVSEIIRNFNIVPDVFKPEEIVLSASSGYIICIPDNHKPNNLESEKEIPIDATHIFYNLYSGIF
jgi:hypothetical protein